MVSIYISSHERFSPEEKNLEKLKLLQKEQFNINIHCVVDYNAVN